MSIESSIGEMESTFSIPDQTESDETIDFEKFWEANVFDILNELNMVIPLTQNYKPRNSESKHFSAKGLREFQIRECLRKEKEFAKTIFDLIEEAMRDKDNSILLFDMDYTITQCDGEEYVIRPVVPKLLDQYLEPLRRQALLKIGVISTRTTETTIKFLSPLEALGEIGDHFDSDQIYECRNEYLDEIKQKYGRWIPWSLLRERFGGSQGIMDDALMDSAPLDDQEGCVQIDDLQKLATLTEIRTENPDTNIIVVDDMRYPKYIKKNIGIYAASVEDSRFMIV